MKEHSYIDIVRMVSACVLPPKHKPACSLYTVYGGAALAIVPVNVLDRQP